MEPVTRENCERLNHFEHARLTNRDREKSPLRARRNGKTKVWKRRPDEFSIPAKYGLYDFFYITHNNMHEWNGE
jgi:hypothetical protein